jgi:phosphoglycolate phosphatase
MLAEAFGLTPEHKDYEVLREEFFVNYERRMTHLTTIFDGVAQVIEQLLQREMVWGVVTNKSTRFTEPLTLAMPLFTTAGVVVSGDTTPHAKPHPAPLLEAASRLRLDPVRCVYVGDDERDIVAGRAAGMGTVAATYGYLGARSNPLHWGAHAVINSPAELLKLLWKA